MTSNRDNSLPDKRPYLLRAIWQWCMEAGLTPQILVNAAAEGVNVPAEYVKDGAIVLNVHDRAVRDLDMNNESVSFSARFAGRARSVFVPVDAVVAIYARENGQGLFFETPAQPQAPSASSDGQDGQDGKGDEGGEGDAPPRRGRPDLRIV